LRSSTKLVVALGAALSLWAASPAAAKTIEVEPSESIQAAVDAAKPGDTIRIDNGIYRQNVTITTDGLTIVGAGGGPARDRPQAGGDAHA
jgi:pectin methylesterase-like acyl-CoA thioesterase